MLKFVCWKWQKIKTESFRYRETYTAKHVNIFASMVSRHYHKPHEIVCITDDSTGIDKNIRIVPIWPDLAKYGMCYRRLKIFSTEMKDIIGEKFVSMDLDCVILDDITNLFNDIDFKIWQPNSNPHTPYCGSMFMMKAGSREKIWNEFKEKDLYENKDRYVHKKAYNKGFKVGSDQAWISYKLYPNEAIWTKNDGIYNFNKDIYKKYRTKQKRLNNARIIFFPGVHDPSHKNLYKEDNWIRRNWC